MSSIPASRSRYSGTKRVSRLSICSRAGRKISLVLHARFEQGAVSLVLYASRALDIPH